MGTGKTTVSFLIEAIVIPIYVLFVYVAIYHFNANVTVAWITEIVYGILLTILSYLYLKKGNWRKKTIW